MYMIHILYIYCVILVHCVFVYNVYDTLLVYLWSWVINIMSFMCDIRFVKYIINIDDIIVINDITTISVIYSGVVVGIVDEIQHG